MKFNIGQIQPADENIPSLLKVFKANMMLNVIPDKYLTVDTVTALNVAILKFKY